jgi:hypothetical protein
MDSSLHARRFYPSYLRRAINVILEHDLRAPDEVRLELILRAALEAQALLFHAAVVKPESQKLNALFEAFVVECVR